MPPRPALPAGCPGTASHAPAWELLKLTNPAETISGTGPATPTWPEAAKKNEKRQQVSKEGGQWILCFGRRKLSAFAPFLLLLQIHGASINTIVPGLAPKHT